MFLQRTGVVRPSQENPVGYLVCAGNVACYTTHDRGAVIIARWQQAAMQHAHNGRRVPLLTDCAGELKYCHYWFADDVMIRPWFLPTELIHVPSWPADGMCYGWGAPERPTPLKIPHWPLTSHLTLGMRISSCGACAEPGRQAHNCPRGSRPHKEGSCHELAARFRSCEVQDPSGGKGGARQ